MSPKISFLFGIVTAVAVVSLAGVVFLLSKQGGAGGGGADNSDNGSTGEASPSASPADVSKIISDIGEKIGLNADAFDSCVQSGKYAEKVNSDSSDAQKAGGNGTPFTVIVGPNGPAMTVSGALPVEFFKTIIDTLLAGGNAMEKVTPELQPYVTEAKNLAYKQVDGDDHIRGSAEAKVKLIEYSDFQCPFCAQAQPTLMQIRQDYPQIKHVFRNYPLASHPSAGKAAEAAECAGLQGKFWEMHDGLFASQNSLSVDSLKEYALGLFLDQAEFDSCLGSNKTAQAVAAQAAEAASVGVRATPSFLVFSKSGANEAARKKAQEEAQALSARYSQFRLPVNTVEVQGAGLGIVFAGALQYSDFAEVLSAFGASPQAKAE